MTLDIDHAAIRDLVARLPLTLTFEEFAGRGYGDLKGAVADAALAEIAPIRERTLELLGERSELERILAEGADRARAVASRTLGKVFRKVGLLPPLRR